MWQCLACTLENTDRKRRCGACGSRRPLGSQEPQSDQRKKPRESCSKVASTKKRKGNRSTKSNKITDDSTGSCCPAVTRNDSTSQDQPPKSPSLPQHLDTTHQEHQQQPQDGGDSRSLSATVPLNPLLSDRAHNHPAEPAANNSNTIESVLPSSPTRTGTASAATESRIANSSNSNSSTIRGRGRRKRGKSVVEGWIERRRQRSQESRLQTEPPSNSERRNNHAQPSPQTATPNQVQATKEPSKDLLVEVVDPSQNTSSEVHFAELASDMENTAKGDDSTTVSAATTSSTIKYDPTKYRSVKLSIVYGRTNRADPATKGKRTKRRYKPMEALIPLAIQDGEKATAPQRVSSSPKEAQSSGSGGSGPPHSKETDATPLQQQNDPISSTKDEESPLLSDSGCSAVPLHTEHESTGPALKRKREEGGGSCGILLIKSEINPHVDKENAVNGMNDITSAASMQSKAPREGKRPLISEAHQQGVPPETSNLGATEQPKKKVKAEDAPDIDAQSSICLPMDLAEIGKDQNIGMGGSMLAAAQAKLEENEKPLPNQSGTTEASSSGPDLPAETSDLKVPATFVAVARNPQETKSNPRGNFLYSLPSQSQITLPSQSQGFVSRQNSLEAQIAARNNSTDGDSSANSHPTILAGDSSAIFAYSLSDSMSQLQQTSIAPRGMDPIIHQNPRKVVEVVALPKPSTSLDNSTSNPDATTSNGTAQSRSSDLVNAVQPRTPASIKCPPAAKKPSLAAVGFAYSQEYSQSQSQPQQHIHSTTAKSEDELLLSQDAPTDGSTPSTIATGKKTPGADSIDSSNAVEKQKEPCAREGENDDVARTIDLPLPVKGRTTSPSFNATEKSLMNGEIKIEKIISPPNTNPMKPLMAMFSTAGNNSVIHVSRESLIKARKLLQKGTSVSNLGNSKNDGNQRGNANGGHHDVDSEKISPPAITPMKPPTAMFSTAGSISAIHVSRESLNKAKKLLQTGTSVNNLGNSKNDGNQSSMDNGGHHDAGAAKNISPPAITQMKPPMAMFSTAGRNSAIHVSRESLNKAKKLLQADTSVSNSKSDSNQPNNDDGAQYNLDTGHKPDCSSRDVLNDKSFAANDMQSPLAMFSTAGSNTAVTVSRESLARAKKLFESTTEKTHDNSPCRDSKPSDNAEKNSTASTVFNYDAKSSFSTNKQTARTTPVSIKKQGSLTNGLKKAPPSPIIKSQGSFQTAKRPFLATKPQKFVVPRASLRGNISAAKKQNEAAATPVSKGNTNSMFATAGSSKAIFVSKEALAKAKYLCQDGANADQVNNSTKGFQKVSSTSQIRRPAFTVPRLVPNQRLRLPHKNVEPLSSAQLHSGEPALSSTGANSGSASTPIALFATAGSNKAITVSAESLRKAKQLFGNDDADVPRSKQAQGQDSSVEMHQPSSSVPSHHPALKAASLAKARPESSLSRQHSSQSLFTTAGSNQPIHVSDESLLRAKRAFASMEDVTHQPAIKKSRPDGIVPPESVAAAMVQKNARLENTAVAPFVVFATAGSNQPIQVSEESMEAAKRLMVTATSTENDVAREKPPTAALFSTAGKNAPIHVSDEALRKACNLFSKIKVPLQTAIDASQSKTCAEPGKLPSDIEKPTLEVKNKVSSKVLFSTAGNQTPILVSEASLEKAKDLFKPISSMHSMMQHRAPDSKPGLKSSISAGTLSHATNALSYAAANTEPTLYAANENPPPLMSKANQLAVENDAGEDKAVGGGVVPGGLKTIDSAETLVQPSSHVERTASSPPTFASTFQESAFKECPEPPKQALAVDGADPVIQSQERDEGSRADSRQDEEVQLHRIPSQSASDSDRSHTGNELNAATGQTIYPMALFSTAGSGRPIEVSKEGLERAKSLFDEQDGYDRTNVARGHVAPASGSTNGALLANMSQSSDLNNDAFGSNRPINETKDGPPRAQSLFGYRNVEPDDSSASPNNHGQVGLTTKPVALFASAGTGALIEVSETSLAKARKLLYGGNKSLSNDETSNAVDGDSCDVFDSSSPIGSTNKVDDEPAARAIDNVHGAIESGNGHHQTHTGQESQPFGYTPESTGTVKDATVSVWGTLATVLRTKSDFSPSAERHHANMYSPSPLTPAQNSNAEEGDLYARQLEYELQISQYTAGEESTHLPPEQNQALVQNAAPSAIVSTGFATAGSGSNIRVSAASLRRASELFDDNSDLSALKAIHEVPTNNFETDNRLSCRPELLPHDDTFCEKKNVPSPYAPAGFVTAGLEVGIHITAESLRKASKLFEDCSASANEDSCGHLMVNNQMENASPLIENIQSNFQQEEVKPLSFSGFRIAGSGTEIKVSEEALKMAAATLNKDTAARSVTSVTTLDDQETRRNKNVDLQVDPTLPDASPLPPKALCFGDTADCTPPDVNHHDAAPSPAAFQETPHHYFGERTAIHDVAYGSTPSDATQTLSPLEARKTFGESDNETPGKNGNHPQQPRTVDIMSSETPDMMACNTTAAAARVTLSMNGNTMSEEYTRFQQTEPVTPIPFNFHSDDHTGSMMLSGHCEVGRGMQNDFPKSLFSRNLENDITTGAMTATNEERLRDGVGNVTMRVSSINAGSILLDKSTQLPSCFASELIDDGESRTNTQELLGHVKDLRESLLGMACNSKLMTDKWIANHKRWIVWKLASTERQFSRHLGGKYLTYQRLLFQLRARYLKEIEEGKRSAVRKVLNRDVAASRMMILCVGQIFSSSIKVEKTDLIDEHTIVKHKLELSDGWHAVQASLDEKLNSLVADGAIKVGTKLLVSSAYLVGADEGTDPLDESYDSSDSDCKVGLIVSANAVRLARWNAKLGFVPITGHNVLGKGQLCVKRINDIQLGGGNLPSILLHVLEAYPRQFFEKLDPAGSNPSSTVLSEAEEEARRQSFEKRKQLEMEKISEKLEKEVEDEVDEDGPKTWLELKNSNCPGEFYEGLSMDEKREMEAWREKRSTILRDRIQKEVEAELEVDNTFERESVPFVRALVTSYHGRLNGTSSDGRALLTIWKPSEEHIERLENGATMLVSNLGVRNTKYDNRFQLTANSRTRMEPIHLRDIKTCTTYCAYQSFLRIHVQSRRRAENDASGIARSIRPQEFDTVGAIFHIDDDDNIYLTDASNLILRVERGDHESAALNGKFSVGQCAAFHDLHMCAFDTEQNCAVAQFGSQSRVLTTETMIPPLDRLRLWVDPRSLERTLQCHLSRINVRASVNQTAAIGFLAGLRFDSSSSAQLHVEVECGPDGIIHQWELPVELLDSMLSKCLAHQKLMQQRQFPSRLQGSQHHQQEEDDDADGRMKSDKGWIRLNADEEETAIHLGKLEPLFRERGLLWRFELRSKSSRKGYVVESAVVANVESLAHSILHITNTI